MSRTGIAGAVLGAALVLSACQGPPIPPEDDGSCVPAAAGQASDSVMVSGASGTVPRVAFEELGAVHTTQRTVVREGHGRMAEWGALATFSYAVYDGSSGDPIDEVGFDGQHVQVALDDTALVPGLSKALLCSTQGSRVVAVVPPEEAFGTQGAVGYGISGGTTLVVVIDLIAVAADRADGMFQEMENGSLPEVTVGATGEPRVRIPPISPPTELVTRALRVGDGELVTEGAKVAVKYIGIDWKSSRTFDSSWARDEVVQRPTTDFVKGFGSALHGSTVGSQLLVVIPPGLGYDDAGNERFGLSAGDTIVFVIDVLAVVPPPGEGE